MSREVDEVARPRIGRTVGAATVPETGVDRRGNITGTACRGRTTTVKTRFADLDSGHGINGTALIGCLNVAEHNLLDNNIGGGDLLDVRTG
jgi:hypothetical protein